VSLAAIGERLRAGDPGGLPTNRGQLGSTTQQFQSFADAYASSAELRAIASNPGVDCGFARRPHQGSGAGGSVCLRSP